MFLLQEREQPWSGAAAVWPSEVKGHPRTDVCPQNPVFSFLAFQPSGRLLDGITAQGSVSYRVLWSKVEFDPSSENGQKCHVLDSISFLLAQAGVANSQTSSRRNPGSHTWVFFLVVTVTVIH